MKFGIVVFPGSNCDEDCHHVAKDLLGLRRRLHLAPRHGPQGRGRRHPAGGLRLRRLPSGGRARALLARHGERREVRRAGRPGPRHLQRFPGAPRGGTPSRSDAHQPRPPLRLPRCPHARRERRDAVHIALSEGERREDADRPHGGQLHGASRRARQARTRGPRRVPLLRPRGARHRRGQSERRGARHRRHRERGGQRRRADAAPRPLLRSAPRQRPGDQDVPVRGGSGRSRRRTHSDRRVG